jgi:hypothetical protein
LDPFVLLDQAVAQGRLKPAIGKRVKAKGDYLEAAIKRVEKASGLRYPPYYVDPSLSVATTSIEYGSVGALFARVIPANFEGGISIIVQFSAPLVLFGGKPTIEAVAAHEFTHYIDLVRRFSSLHVSSDESATTLFESGYADEERLVNPASIFSDKKLVALVNKKFAGGLVDEKLNDKVASGWIEKELPTKRVSPEENAVKVNIDNIGRSKFDPMVLAKIREIEEKK